tara:strand:+ start:3458 stop:3718 length:261 start_codon:yes stop_codon:yes gene_type:complete
MFIALVKDDRQGKWEPIPDNMADLDLENDHVPPKLFKNQKEAETFQETERHRFMMIIPVFGMVEVRMLGNKFIKGDPISREIIKIV